jgi:hypothetical protein
VRLTPLTPRARRLAKVALQRAASCPQAATGFFGHLGDDLCRDRVDLLVGQGFFARLDRHRDGD